MWYAIFILIGLLLVSILVNVILASLLAGANKEVLAEKEKAKEQQSDWQKAQANKSDELQRAEKVIASLKAEIEILEKDDAATSDPTVVRARLRKLFP